MIARDWMRLRTESFEILAVSFVRSAFDVVSVRSALGRDDVMMMAKIETGEGVENWMRSSRSRRDHGRAR